MKLDFSSDNSTIALVEDFAQNGHSENNSQKDTTTLRAGIKAAQRGDRSEARQLLMRVTEADPGCESAWLWLASISEYPEELLIFLNNVLDINPGNERAIEWAKATKSLLAKTFVQRGIEANNQEQKQFARQCFMQAIVHDNRNEMAWLWLASVTDAAEEKVGHLNRVLEINPDNEQARESIRASKEKMMQAALAKAENAFDNGDREKAESHLGEVFGFDPQNEDGWFLKSRLADSFEEKTACFEKMLEFNPENSKARKALENAKDERVSEFFAKAEESANYGDSYRANESLEEVFRLDPNHENAWFLKSRLSNSFEEKLDCFEKMLALDPENEKASEALKEAKNERAAEYFANANDEANEGNREQASELLKEVFAQNPNHEDAWILKSRLTDSFEEKLACFERILEFNPNNETAQAGVKLRAMLNGGAAKTEEPVSFASEETAEAVAEETTEENSEEQFFDGSAQENSFENQETETETMTEDEEPVPVVSFSNETVSASDETEEFNYFVADILEEANKVELAEAEVSAQAEDFAVEEKVEENYSENYSAEMSSEENFAEYQTEENQQNLAEENQTETLEENSAEFEKAENVFARYAENYGVEDFSKNEVPTEEVIYEAPVTEVFEPAETSENDFHAETAEVENVENAESENAEVTHEVSEKPHAELRACAFCAAKNDVHALVCVSCRSLLTLSDMEMILAYNEADQNTLREAVALMEVEEIQRGLESEELVSLAIGYINLKNLRKGLEVLQKASKLDPNNIVLKAQANSLAIRLSEIEQKDAIHSSMPKDRTIMVVDDSATVRKLISGKLEKCGHIVITAVDGMDAMAKLNDVVPDLILLDITMPRMDGYQVCKLIRNNDSMKEVPVVMISGKDGFFDKVRGRMAGTTGYITKPFGPETLMKMLDTYLV